MQTALFEQTRSVALKKNEHMICHEYYLVHENCCQRGNRELSYKIISLYKWLAFTISG